MSGNQIAGVILLELLCLVCGWMLGMGTMNNPRGTHHRVGVFMMKIGGYALIAEAASLCLSLIFGVFS